MALVTITEAAKLADKARKTLYAHIKQGKLSCVTQPDGSKLIDISELIRAYGEIKQGNTEVTPEPLPDVTPSNVTFSDDRIDKLLLAVEQLQKTVGEQSNQIKQLTNILEHKPIEEPDHNIRTTKSQPEFLKPEPVASNYIDDMKPFGKH